MEIVKNLPADGYTFVYVNSSMMCINPYVYKKLPYDGFKDFVPVTQHGLAPLAMVVPPSLGIKSVKEFVVWANERKGKVNFASFGNGSSSHIWGEMLNQAEKLDMTHVPYKGAGPAVQDTVAGHIPMTIQDLAASGGAINGGKLTPLAVTSAKRWPRLPDVPTFEEAGYKINLTGWNGIMAPAGTPKDIVDKVGGEVAKAMKDESLRKRLAEQAVIPVGATPAETAKFLQAEVEKWEKVITSAGVKIES
jgi:tripartite-type tricarboxylate transporter receptor subunit TctC